MSQKPLSMMLVAAVVAAACSDNTVSSPSSRPIAPSSASAERALNTNERFVSIGTSISMGWSSNGVYYGTQKTAWPTLLEFGFTGVKMSYPAIQAPGCTSPLIYPLGAGLRLSGEPATGSTVCAPLMGEVKLPTQNVALATAIAADAVQKTPAIAGPSLPFYARVLPPGMTQLTAALSQQPTIVSVELGGNEVLGATSGLYAPGVTVVPLPFFLQPYNALLDALSNSHVKAVLVGLIADARNLAAMRRGGEIWNNRAEFAALHVDVSPDCRESPNWINVSIKSLTMAFTGAQTFAMGFPNPVYSCADVPGTQDQVLTPADISAINAQLAQMTAFIQQQASARGFAYFALGDLYDRNPDRVPYSVVRQLTSPTPFGPYISLDGVHPNPAGHAVLAAAAARAINLKYGVGSGDNHAALVQEASEMSLSDRLIEPTISAIALDQARSVAAKNKNTRLPACFIPGAC
jgi:hypothetical protein